MMFRRPIPAVSPYQITGVPALRGEVIRKSLHMLIALVPGIASVVGVMPTLTLLATGVLFYTSAEYLRIHGHQVAFVSTLTVLASRPRDRGHFVIGPVTLGIGAMLALLLYPAPAAFLAIYALAFGDGFASLFGRAYGRLRPIGSKTLEGSLACLVSVFVASVMVTGRVGASLVLAAVATLLEALPTDDLDNVLLPMGVGLVATLLLAI